MKCSRCGKIPKTGILAFNMPNIDGWCRSCLDKVRPAVSSMSYRAYEASPANNHAHGYDGLRFQGDDGVIREVMSGKPIAPPAPRLTCLWCGADLEVGRSSYCGIPECLRKGSEAGQQARSEIQPPAIPFAERVEVAKALDAARERIAELEAMNADQLETIREPCRVCQIHERAAAELNAEASMWNDKLCDEQMRANRLGDEAGELRTMLNELKVENSDLHRALERAERKAGKR